MDPVQELHKLGWTELEAKVYVSMTSSSQSLTGYQIAKIAGIARANVYPALDKLVLRGAILEEPQPSGSRYQAVPFKLISQAQLRSLSKSLSRIEQNLPQIPRRHRLITAHGQDILESYAINLVMDAKSYLDIGASHNTIQSLAIVLSQAHDRGVAERFVCFDNCPTPGCGVCRKPLGLSLGKFNPKGWLVLTKDNEETLIAMGTGDETELVLTSMEPVRESLRVLFSALQRNRDSEP
jgi:sugar-specific transcriptional regulator TrmB